MIDWKLHALGQALRPFKGVYLRGLNNKKNTQSTPNIIGFCHHSMFGPLTPALAMLLAKEHGKETGQIWTARLNGVTHKDEKIGDWIVTVEQVRDSLVAQNQGDEPFDPEGGKRTRAYTKTPWPLSPMIKFMGDAINAWPDTFVWTSRSLSIDPQHVQTAAISFCKHANDHGLRPGQKLWTAIDTHSHLTGTIHHKITVEKTA